MFQKNIPNEEGEINQSKHQVGRYNRPASSLPAVNPGTSALPNPRAGVLRGPEWGSRGSEAPAFSQPTRGRSEPKGKAPSCRRGGQGSASGASSSCQARRRQVPGGRWRVRVGFPRRLPLWRPVSARRVQLHPGTHEPPHDEEGEGAGPMSTPTPTPGAGPPARRRPGVAEGGREARPVWPRCRAGPSPAGRLRGRRKRNC